MDFQVQRKDYRQTRWIETPPAAEVEVGPGEALIRVDRFAFTANNITYAVVGEMIGYWKFFPAEDGWGRIPVWGIGIVERSNAEGVEEGERFFGYFPMSSYLKVQPSKAGAAGFTDASTHRQALPPTYNQYSRMKPELGFDPDEDDAVMVFRPLFMTSFLIDDFLADNDFFGARQIVLSSASSKTSFGTAFLLEQRADAQIEVAGLTSSSNRAFVEGLGCYQRVVTYDKLEDLPRDLPAVFVDMAGNAETLSDVHRHFGDHLKYSCRVGMTHWEENKPVSKLPGAEPQFFFAPDQIRKRTKDWGPEGVQKRFGNAWAGFTKLVDAKIEFEHGSGRDDVEHIYNQTLEGRVPPKRAQILSL
jgi:hypothetical protein